ncbi:MAG: hypothetical protein L0154_04060 [Chloroflexi bacterium]|nr:hypothetical protein [Chloroflexota bacterium]
MTDWLTPFLTASPAMAWFFLGIGTPWALVLLPRRDWRDWTMITGLALALGPVFGTTWLFILGTVAKFDFLTALTGTIIVAVIGLLIAWSRRSKPVPDDAVIPDDGLRFPALKWALLAMMTIGVVAMIWDTAFWPFLRYDTLWTFGYNPKIFILHREIPSWIDYYPQNVPLTFTFADLAWGEHNDHAARAAVPWFFLSTILATYLLGWCVFRSRMVGLLSAGLWTLLPSSLVWASSGDLEHPMVTYFTLAALFFILAWRETKHETRYAILSGLCLSGAMWTKPTAGAFVMGVVLVLAVVTVIAYRRQSWAWWWSRVRIMVRAGLASAPIGGMWYFRNILAGHAWTNLPASYWTDLAQRSGMQLTWLYVIAAVASLYLITRQHRTPHQLALTIAGIALLSIAILPTLLSIPEGGWTSDTTWDWLNGFREPYRRLNALEFVLILIGTGLLIWSGRHEWQRLSLPTRQGIWLMVGLGAPFFAVYFWSFSYHYRLGLTVLPLMLTPLVALFTAWLMPIILQNRLRKTAMIVMVVTLSLIAPVAASYHTLLNTFKEDGVRSDREKYAYANPALMDTVGFLEDYAAQHGDKNYHILAPGENRLAFFLPEWDVDDETLPAEINDLEDYDLFIPLFAPFLWRTSNLYPNQVQAWLDIAGVYPPPQNGQLPPDGPHGQPMPRVLVPTSPVFDDGTFRYIVYEVDASAAYADIVPENPLDEVVFGDVMQLLGYDISTRTLTPGETITIKFYWQGTPAGPPQRDYTIYVHFWSTKTGDLLTQADGGLMYGLFPTRFLTPGLALQDRRDWTVPADLPSGPVEMRVGVYVPDGPRLDATIMGQPAGDGVTIATDLMIARQMPFGG